jgi:2-polyprenyl-3-methyl-5-hydroxy-6-metoxy-1,4-benzoquinol methylase
MKKIKHTQQNSLSLYRAILKKAVFSTKSELTLPPITKFGILNDPLQFTFRLARHKFISKILNGKNVLEIGCQEGFTSMLVAKSVKNLVAIDFYRNHIVDAKRYISPHVKNVEFITHDITSGPVKAKHGPFNAAFSLDVLEHIDKTLEKKFFENVIKSLQKKSIFIVGMPSIESQKYASAASKIGHVNCKTGEKLKKTCSKYF